MPYLLLGRHVLGILQLVINSRTSLVIAKLLIELPFTDGYLASLQFWVESTIFRVVGRAINIHFLDEFDDFFLLIKVGDQFLQVHGIPGPARIPKPYAKKVALSLLVVVFLLPENIYGKHAAQTLKLTTRFDMAVLIENQSKAIVVVEDSWLPSMAMRASNQLRETISC